MPGSQKITSLIFGAHLDISPCCSSTGLKNIQLNLQARETLVPKTIGRLLGLMSPH